jgi:hypothetical protein
VANHHYFENHVRAIVRDSLDADLVLDKPSSRQKTNEKQERTSLMILGWRVHANLEQSGVEARQEASGQQQRDVLVQEHPGSCQASSGIYNLKGILSNIT